MQRLKPVLLLEQPVAANSSCVRLRMRRKVFTRGTRRSHARSASVSGCASGSRAAAASISAALIGLSGSTGTTSSVPSGFVRTKEPSRCILAEVKVDVLLILRGPAGQHDPNRRVPFRVDDGQYVAVLHSQRLN